MIINIKQTLCSSVYTAIFLCITSSEVNSQTLNEVVTEQLAFDGSPCAELLGSSGSAFTDLTGSLRDICTRGTPSGPTAPSNSGGGGAATPTSLPRIVKRRLQDDEQDESGSGASGDQVIELTPAVSLFLSGEYQSLDRDVTTFEDGYDSDIWRLTTGTDFRIQELLTAGVAFDYRHQKGDYAGSGDFKLDSYGALVFASITPVEDFFVQISGGYSFQENDRRRFTSFNEEVTNFSRTGFVSSDYDADEFSASIQTGYDFNIANITIGPRAGLDWVRNNYDSYTETGNTGLELSFAKDHRTSLQSRFGLFSSAAFSTGFGVIVPQFGADWVHEFEDDQREIDFSFADDLRNKVLTFQNENPDRDFFEIHAGTSIVMAHGFQAFVNYRAIIGHSYFDGHSANLGLGVEF